MPKNTAVGFFIGLLAFAFGFAMIWHIWWMALSGALGILLLVVVRSANDDVDYHVPAAEVEKMENVRFNQLKSSPQAKADINQGTFPVFAQPQV